MAEGELGLGEVEVRRRLNLELRHQDRMKLPVAEQREEILDMIGGKIRALASS